MAGDFISDADMQQLEASGQAITPDFIPDNQADTFFGTQATAPMGVQAEPMPSTLSQYPAAFSDTVGKAYDLFRNAPVIKQAGQVVGGLTGLLGGAIGGTIGAGGQVAKNLYQGQPVFNDVINQTVQSAKDTASFGYGFGKEAPAAALTGYAGRIPTALLSYNQLFQGGKGIAEAEQPQDYVQPIAQTLTGLAGAAYAARPFGNSGSLVRPDLRRAITEQAPMLNRNITGEPGVTENALPPEIIQPFKSAIKPGTNNRQFNADLRTALEQIKPQLSEVKDINDFHSLLGTEKVKVWKEVQQAQQEAGKQFTVIDGSQAANKIREILQQPSFRRENVTLIKGKGGKMVEEYSPLYRELETKAKAYDGLIPADEAQSIVEIKNAELNQYYNQTRSNQAAVRKANPSKAADIILSQELNNQLETALSKMTKDGSFKALKNKYGALSNIQETVGKRINVAERQNPNSLAEQISGARTVGNMALDLVTGKPLSAASRVADYATARILKTQNSSNGLLQAGIKNYLQNYGKFPLFPSLVPLLNGAQIQPPSPIQKEQP